MEEIFDQAIYSKQVIEFVTVANEFCTYLESNSTFEKHVFVKQLQGFLPLLYLKATTLPTMENVMDEGVEHYVTEFDYYQIQNSIIELLGSDDDYVRLFDAEYSEEHEPVNSSISENIADVYQSLKDFIMNYRGGIDEIMNDALWECKVNFMDYWGGALVDAQKAIHMLINKKNWDEDSGQESQPKKEGARKTFFNDVQDQFNDEIE
jgi:hypothetical protein